VEYLDLSKVKVEDAAKKFLKAHLNNEWKSTLKELKSDFNESELPNEITAVKAPVLFKYMKTIFEAHHDMRILALGHHGPSGTISLNQLARKLLDTDKKDPSKRIHGELVMVTRNQNDIGLYNGDSGIVVLLKKFRYVIFPLDNSYRVEPLERIHYIESAFAISVHKSQGSEYKEILIALPDHKSKLLTREILYTGITRAKQKAIIHGSAELFGEGVKRFVDRPSALSTWLEA
jgi:exodeoxyribonuclease V alpha subunit